MRQDFDRHDSAQSRVRGPIHFAHAARAKRAEDFKRAEASAGRKSHVSA